MESYPAHSFRALWQQRQLQQNIDGLKEGEILVNMDFSENYKCHFRDEVQLGYFNQAPVTVHPMMAYYVKEESASNIPSRAFPVIPNTTGSSPIFSKKKR